MNVDELSLRIRDLHIGRDFLFEVVGILPKLLVSLLDPRIVAVRWPKLLLHERQHSHNVPQLQYYLD